MSDTYTASDIYAVYADMMRRFLAAHDSTTPIYAENVRAFFDIGFAQSALVLDAGMKEGLICQRTAWMCPNDDRVLFESPLSIMADKLACDICAALEIEPHSFWPADCRKIQLFRIKTSSTKAGA